MTQRGGVRGAVWIAVFCAFAGACGGAAFRGIGPAEPRWRFSHVSGQGDAERRASNRLVAEALRDSNAGSNRAVERIRRALQVDPTNPWAYLALAREQVVEGDARGALASVDQAEARLGLEGEIPPVLQAHLVGLRGAAEGAWSETGESALLLNEAARLAPDEWRDGMLSASELR